MPYQTVRLRGLAELNRNLGRISKQLRRELRQELKSAAEPVADRAQMLAPYALRNMARNKRAGGIWSKFRIGQTSRVVYIVPRAHRLPGHNLLARPNYADYVSERAMAPAAEQERPEVLRRLEVFLASFGRRHF